MLHASRHGLLGAPHPGQVCELPRSPRLTYGNAAVCRCSRGNPPPPPPRPWGAPWPGRHRHSTGGCARAGRCRAQSAGTTAPAAPGQHGSASLGETGGALGHRAWGHTSREGLARHGRGWKLGQKVGLESRAGDLQRSGLRHRHLAKEGSDPAMTLATHPGHHTRGCHAAPEGHFYTPLPWESLPAPAVLGKSQAQQVSQPSRVPTSCCGRWEPGCQTSPGIWCCHRPLPCPTVHPPNTLPPSPSSILFSSGSPPLSVPSPRHAAATCSVALAPRLAAPAPSPAARGPSAMPCGRLAERLPSPAGSGPPSRRGALQRGSDCSECRVSQVFFSLVWLVGGHGKRPPELPRVGSKGPSTPQPTPGHPSQPGVVQRQAGGGSGLARAIGYCLSVSGGDGSGSSGPSGEPGWRLWYARRSSLGSEGRPGPGSGGKSAAWGRVPTQGPPQPPAAPGCRRKRGWLVLGGGVRAWGAGITELAPARPSLHGAPGSSGTTGSPSPSLSCPLPSSCGGAWSLAGGWKPGSFFG